MSLSVGAGMAIAGGVAAATSAGNAIAQGKMNRKNRKWQEKMYMRRLADQRQDWQMTNEYNEEMYNKYNSPSAQVRQLQNAGINPDLQDLSSAGLGDASTPSSVPDVGDGAFDMPNIDFAGTFAQMLSAYYQLSSQALDADLKRQELRRVAKGDVLEHLTNLYNPKQDYDNRFNPITVDTDGFGTGKNGEVESIKSSRLRGGNKYYRSLGYSKAASRYLTKMENIMMQDSSYNEVRENYYTKKLNTLEGRKAYFKSFTDGFGSDSDDELSAAFKTFNDKAVALRKIMDDALSAKSKYETDFYNSRDGSQEGESTTSSIVSDADVKRGYADSLKNLDKKFQDIMSGWDDNSIGASIGKFALESMWSFFRNNYLK